MSPDLALAILLMATPRSSRCTGNMLEGPTTSLQLTDKSVSYTVSDYHNSTRLCSNHNNS